MLEKKIEYSVKRIDHSSPPYSQLEPPYEKQSNSIESNYTEKLKIPLLTEVKQNKPFDDCTIKKENRSEKLRSSKNFIQSFEEIPFGAILNFLVRILSPNLTPIKTLALKIMLPISCYFAPFIIVVLFNCIKKRNKTSLVDQVKSSDTEDAFKATKGFKIYSWTEIWFWNALLRLVPILFIFGISFLNQHECIQDIISIVKVLVSATSVIKAIFYSKMVNSNHKDSLIFSKIEEPNNTERLEILIPERVNGNNPPIT